MSAAHGISACRACGAPLGAVFCDLGQQPVANSYLPDLAHAAGEPRFPLRARICTGCALVQLDTVVDAAGIFTDYAYFSSASDSWLAHAAAFTAAITARLGLTQDSFVVEVASNDGYLLRNFVAAGIPCLGIEPAANVAAVARAAGVPTEARFFGLAAAQEIVAAHGHADLVVANNVLAHVPDINDFAAGLAHLAGPRGTVSIEAPHLLALVDGVQFDTIYHEHYAYWSLSSMAALLARHGLGIVSVAQLATHGGSLRVLARAGALPDDAAARLLAEEAARGPELLEGFQPRVTEVLAGLRAWLAERHAAGRRVAAYGAAAKGNTLLNAAGVTAADILAVADRSPAKQGRLLPGSHIPVVTPGALLALAPDDILILPWNIAAEVTAQLREAGFAGGLFTAVPAMRGWP
jgi:hypothetical protein